MKRNSLPEALLNDERVDYKLIGMYTILMFNAEDGKHVAKTAKYLREQMQISSKDTYIRYRKKLEELGYISISRDGLYSPSVITLKGNNDDFKSADFNDIIPLHSLSKDMSPQAVFESLFYVKIPKLYLNKIKHLGISDNVMYLALMKTKDHKENFLYYDYPHLINYAIKIAQDLQKHDVNDVGDLIRYEEDFFNSNSY